MPPKAAQLSSVATTLGQSNTSIAESSDADLQVVTRGQLQAVLDQLYSNNTVWDKRLNNIGSIKVKMLLIKWFDRMKSKLKGFLI